MPTRGLPASSAHPSAQREHNDPQRIQQLLAELSELSEKYKNQIFVIGPGRKAKLKQILNSNSDIGIRADKAIFSADHTLQHYQNTKRFVIENLAADEKEQKQLELNFMRKYGPHVGGALRVSASGGIDFFVLPADPQQALDRARNIDGCFIIGLHRHGDRSSTMFTETDTRNGRIVATYPLGAPHANRRTNNQTVRPTGAPRR